VDAKERERLILENRKFIEILVDKAIKKLGIPKSLTRKDLISYATIKMIEAIDSYDSDNKGKLSSWIFLNVYGWLRSEIRRWSLINKNEVNFNPDYLGIEGPSYTFDEVKEFMDALSEEDQELFIRSFLLGEIQEEIAADFGITRQAISLRIKKVEDKIGDFLSYDGK